MYSFSTTVKSKTNDLVHLKYNSNLNNVLFLTIIFPITFFFMKASGIFQKIKMCIGGKNTVLDETIYPLVSYHLKKKKHEKVPEWGFKGIKYIIFCVSIVG